MTLPEDQSVSTLDSAAEIREDLFCQECGYNLRGLLSDRCPECGRSLDGIRWKVPRLPWVYRAEIGRRRAYWRTVWLVMFRHKQFCEEVARPVDYADAQRFRWVTVLHVWATLLIATGAIYAFAGPKLLRDSGLHWAFQAGWPVAVFHVLQALFLAAATGLPSYFFHPRGIPLEQQNRAIALSYYACAALAWTPFTLAIVLLGLATKPVNEIAGSVLTMTGAFLPAGLAFAYVADLVHIGVRVMPQRKRRLAALVAVLPLLWVMLAGLVFLGVPFLIFCSVILAGSFA